MTNSLSCRAGPEYLPQPRSQAGKPRLLLADDNSAVLEHVCGMLAKDFDIVAAATSGDAVLRDYKEVNPDLFVLDISMGSVGGLEVARTLRANGNIAPVVFLTVHHEADFVKAALSCGGSAYVVKSHLTNDLIPAIKAALSGKMFISPVLHSSSDV